MGKGTSRPHGKTIGYIVVGQAGYVGTLCHGYNDERRRVLLGGNPVTLFSSRRTAMRAIRESMEDDDNRCERFRILRVAQCSEESGR